MTLDIADYKTESFTISKGIQDALWVFSAQIDKHIVPAFFETIHATATDHLDNPHTPFVGIIPATDYALAASSNKATLTGYDYGWYLTVQYVPSDERITEEDTNPSETITTLLGGTSWATVTGIEPYRINTVTDWTNIKKSFEFGDRHTRWKAIQEICDYCNFVFVVKWRDVAGTWRPCAYFVHEDDIDTAGSGLDIPAMVTITDPDSYLMDGITALESPEHQYNKILATGYDVATETYFYATAQTAEVTAGTEIPIEYVYADAALNTQSKTGIKAQELLNFFQESAKVYVARFKRRMDLELYQKISFVGYNKIDTDEMRITRISYSRSASNDMVEIEFSKDQAIQQLRRIARAVNPDYVSGTLDMVNTDLSDIGLIDVFDDPFEVEDDLWSIDGAYVQLVDPAPLNLQGWSLDNVSSVKGAEGADISFWGNVEFARWKNHTTGEIISKYLEIEQDIYINNDSRFPKIYFDVDPTRPTYIRGNRYDAVEGGFDGLDITIGGEARGAMVSFINPTDVSQVPYIHLKREVRLSPDLIVGGVVEGWGNNDLKFWDKATGSKTLKQLSTPGNADSVRGWKFYGLYGTVASVPAGWRWHWEWTLPYTGTRMIVTPSIVVDTEFGWYSDLSVFVMRKDFGDWGIDIMLHNGSGVDLDLMIEGIVMYY